MTNVGRHADWLAELPDDPAELRSVVTGLVLHSAWAGAYGVTVDARGEAEEQLRAADDIVDAVRGRSEASPREPRRPLERAVGVCRNFVVLYVALLRARGHPARARCGHASYFEAGRWVDHWVAERWDADAGRWIRCDPQLDDVQLGAIPADVDPDGLAPGAFLSGGECWQQVRKGEVDPDTCGIFDMWGAWFVRSNVVRDLAALNKVELLPWDGWAFAEDQSGLGTDEDNATVDAVADVCARSDLTELRAAYADERFRVPPVITSFLKTGPTQVRLDL
jgi:transglutaminase-like putative cysteine protease